MTKTQGIEAGIITVRELLEQPHLHIPGYQRPYKWTVQHVNALIDDFFHFRHFPKYRLGTLVQHYEAAEKKYYIVDGQQRSITLALIALAISRSIPLREKIREHQLHVPTNALLTQFHFPQPTSQENIRTNYREIERHIADFDIEAVRFFFDRCELVRVVLNDISEAFQFFDSQNARGKDLEPHDLLKAFHLREIAADVPEKAVKDLTAQWEDLDSNRLSHAFSHYLFRVKQWSRGQSARYFDKNDIGSFKGISPDVQERYPYAKMYRIAHFYVEGYNQAYHRRIDQKHMPFPFQLDRVVINGKRFFEMVLHYLEPIKQLDTEKSALNYLQLEKESKAKSIITTLYTYKERHRTGDGYVRNLFNTGLLYYIDKFGHTELERIVEKLFVWAYSLRLRRQNVQLASMDNHALQAPYLFSTIRTALHPSEVLSLGLPLLEANDYQASTKSGKLNDILQHFDQLNYLA